MSTRSMITTPQKPPKLKNTGVQCYANALFQTLFNLDGVTDALQNINDDDPLKKIALEYNKNEDEYNGVNLFPYYTVFGPYQKLSLSDMDFTQHDPAELLSGIFQEYPMISKLFRFINDEDEDFSTFIGIQPNYNDIQECLNARIAGHEHEFEQIPRYLAIKVERIGAHNKLVNKKIEINKSIRYTAICQPNAQTSYFLKSVICHKNFSPTSGHFVAIVRKSEDEIYYCDDTHIYMGIPHENTIEIIKSKSYILVYEKAPDNTFTDGYLSINVANGTIHSKCLTKMSEENTQETPLHVTRDVPISSFTTATVLKTKKTQLAKPIVVKINGIIGEEEIPTEIVYNPNEFAEAYKTTHDSDNITRIELHQQYKYMYGYLEVNKGQTLKYDYEGAAPSYKEVASLLEKFVSIICNFVYKVATDNGQINANTTAELLGINVCKALNEQVVEIGSVIYTLFKDYVSKKLIPEDSEIEEKLAEILKEYIIFDDDNDIYGKEISNRKKKYRMQALVESNRIPLYPDNTYNWEERVDVLGLVHILDSIKAKQKHSSTPKCDACTALRKKFWEDYIKKRDEHKTDKSFVEAWCKARADNIAEGEQKFAISTGTKLLTAFKKNDGPIESHKRSGVKPKITDASRLCILATVMDYPYLTDKERTEYLNKYGANVMNPVTEKTVNMLLNDMQITIKTPAFSAKERNTLGFLIARYVWTQAISEVKQNKNVIMCFIDEAGVKKSSSKSSRGYLSVTPVVTGEHSQYNVATIIVAIIPGFGNISRWFEGPVTNSEYATFIQEVSYIIRTKICTADNQIVFINDNASIHKVQEVRKVAMDNNLNFFYTVPYSPQTNLPAENFFAQMKFACIFNHRMIRENDESDGKINGTSYHFHTVESIVQKWEGINKENYNSSSTMNIYGAWETVIADCIEGKELTGQHYCISNENSDKITSSCYRK